MIAILLMLALLAPGPADVVPSCAHVTPPRVSWSWTNPYGVERTLYTSGPATFAPGGIAIDQTHGYAPPADLRYGSIEAAEPVAVFVCAGGAAPPDPRVVRLPLIRR